MEKEGLASHFAFYKKERISLKKFRSIFMICIFALLIVAKSNVYAAEYYGDFQYEESEDSIAIYSYNGAD